MMIQPSLSSNDRELLSQIQSQFDSAEQLLGSEPPIWYKFQNDQEINRISDLSLGSDRLKVFKGHFTLETRSAN